MAAFELLLDRKPRTSLDSLVPLLDGATQTTSIPARLKPVRRSGRIGCLGYQVLNAVLGPATGLSCTEGVWYIYDWILDSLSDVVEALYGHSSCNLDM